MFLGDNIVFKNYYSLWNNVSQKMKKDSEDQAKQVLNDYENSC